MSDTIYNAACAHASALRDRATQERLALGALSRWGRARFGRRYEQRAADHEARAREIEAAVCKARCRARREPSAHEIVAWLCEQENNRNAAPLDWFAIAGKIDAHYSLGIDLLAELRRHLPTDQGNV